MGNNQEKLEAVAQQGIHDTVAIMGTWQDDFNCWTTVVEGSKLFRRGRQGRRGIWIALYFRSVWIHEIMEFTK